MLLSRAKPAKNVEGSQDQVVKKKRRKHFPRLSDFLKKRDYVGAATLLEFMESSGKPLKQSLQWQAYCAFHLGDYRKALKCYKKLVMKPDSDDGGMTDYWVPLACCCFFLGMYEEADAAAVRGPETPLQNRLLFHVSHKFEDEKRLLSYHKHLNDVVEDQLCLASIHYLRSHYQEAINIYRRIALEHKEYVAVNVYIALCYYKLDYYDVSQEVLGVYLQQFKDSATALNLKACNHFRLYDGKAAEAELKALQDMASPSFAFAQDLIRHNLVVFREGEGALQVLTPLIDVVPEARLNLVIYFLRQNDLDEAYNLIQDLEPKTPQQYTLKAVVNAAIGQARGSREHLKLAQQWFQLVGGSASECDTIPGRQCMSSCFFLISSFDEVLTYLNSIKKFYFNDDTFNMNYGQALASTSQWLEAEQALQSIQSERIRSDFVYLSWLARCYIMTRKPRMAWELYLKMDTSGQSYSILQLIANECYSMGQFYYAAKAFDVLERLDPDPEYWEGKRGACVGCFQLLIAKQESKDTLPEIIDMLRASIQPEVKHIVSVMVNWARQNRVPYE
eukprot:UC1_evm1s1082